MFSAINKHNVINYTLASWYVDHNGTFIPSYVILLFHVTKIYFECSYCEHFHVFIFSSTLTKKNVITPFCHYYTKTDIITKVEHVRILYYHCINKIKPIELMYCVAIGSQVTLDFTRSCCHKKLCQDISQLKSKHNSKSYR